MTPEVVRYGEKMIKSFGRIDTGLYYDLGNLSDMYCDILTDHVKKFHAEDVNESGSDKYKDSSLHTKEYNTANNNASLNSENPRSSAIPTIASLVGPEQTYQLAEKQPSL